MPNNDVSKRKAIIDPLAIKALKDLDDLNVTQVKDLESQIQKVRDSLTSIKSDPHKPK